MAGTASAVEDPEGWRFWQRTVSGPEAPLATLGRQWDAYANTAPASVGRAESVLRYCLHRPPEDCARGVVSIAAFDVFLKRFGPFRMALRKADSALFQDVGDSDGGGGGGGGGARTLAPWFHGAISRADADNFLRDRPPGTFLVRFSETRQRHMALVYVTADARVKHCLIQNCLERGFGLLGGPRGDTVEEEFASMAEFFERHANILTTPFPSPLADECKTAVLQALQQKQQQLQSQKQQSPPPPQRAQQQPMGAGAYVFGDAMGVGAPGPAPSSAAATTTASPPAPPTAASAVAADASDLYGVVDPSFREQYEHGRRPPAPATTSSASRNSSNSTGSLYERRQEIAAAEMVHGSEAAATAAGAYVSLFENNGGAERAVLAKSVSMCPPTMAQGETPPRLHMQTAVKSTGGNTPRHRIAYAKQLMVRRQDGALDEALQVVDEALDELQQDLAELTRAGGLDEGSETVVREILSTRSSQGRALRCKGDILQKQPARMDEAVDVFQECITCLQSLAYDLEGRDSTDYFQDREVLCHVHLQLAQHCMRGEEYDAAIAHYEQVIAWSEDKRDIIVNKFHENQSSIAGFGADWTQERAEALLNEGIHSYNAKDYGTAISTFERAIRMARMTQNRMIEARGLGNLATVVLKNDTDTTRAIFLYKQCLALLKRMPRYRDTKSRIYHALIGCLMQAAQWKKARLFIDQHIKLARNRKNIPTLRTRQERILQHCERLEREQKLGADAGAEDRNVSGTAHGPTAS